MPSSLLVRRPGRENWTCRHSRSSSHSAEGKLQKVTVYMYLRYLISYCSKCGPRLSEQAAEKLRNRYVMMRGGARQHERDTAKKTSIPITIR